MMHKCRPGQTRNTWITWNTWRESVEIFSQFLGETIQIGHPVAVAQPHYKVKASGETKHHGENDNACGDSAEKAGEMLRLTSR